MDNRLALFMHNLTFFLVFINNETATGSDWQKMQQLHTTALKFAFHTNIIFRGDEEQNLLTVTYDLF